MELAELLPLLDADKQPIEAFRTFYQQKIGFLLYGAIATRPDIAFAILRLSRFNQQPGKKHHKAANHVFHYFAWTQDHYIQYEGDEDISLFVCASDASFGNNTIDQKSF